MNYLLDTHAFIWWALEPEKLSQQVLNVLMSFEHDIFLSIASLWEMQIKMQLHKLVLPLPLPELVSQQQRSNCIELAMLEPAHIYALEHLPFHHKDPFDRMLIAQALVNHWVFISKNAAFSNYPIQLLW